MRITLDVVRCEGFASCVISAPEVFDLDEDSNVAVVLDPCPPEVLVAAVKQAAASCPVRAISVT